MTLSNYCYKKNMTYEQYENLESNITKTAAAIIQQIPKNKVDTGIYYPISEILNYDPNNKELFPFIIQSLKKQGMEFYDNNKFWRL